MIRRRLASALTAAALLIGACGDTKATGVERMITAATLDSLPIVTLTDGGQVCSADGRSLCPLQTAVANWITSDRFALWEPGRPVGAWRVGDTVAVPIGNLGEVAGQYLNPSAVGTNGSGDILVVDARTDSLLRYDSQGKFLDSKSLPKMFGLTAWGFSGSVAVMQRITAKDSLSPAELELRVLKSAGDSAGRIVLHTVIPWLHLDNNEVSAALPLFQVPPIYAVDNDGGLTWSSGERLWVRRLSPSGDIEWTVSSTLTGPAISPNEIAARRQELQAGGVPAIDLDSMVARTPATHAAVTGILVGRDGRILVGRTNIPGSDSVSYIVLAKDGAPVSRLTLSSRVHPLLLSGDSLLVHRPTEGEPWEVRWLTFPKAP